MRLFKDNHIAPRIYIIEPQLTIELSVPFVLKKIILLDSIVCIASSCHILNKESKVKLDKVFPRQWQSERLQAATYLNI
jgi:hypothetical protein